MSETIEHAGYEAGRNAEGFPVHHPSRSCPDGRTKAGRAWWKGFMRGDAERCAEKRQPEMAPPATEQVTYAVNFASGEAVELPNDAETRLQSALAAHEKRINSLEFEATEFAEIILADARRARLGQGLVATKTREAYVGAVAELVAHVAKLDGIVKDLRAEWAAEAELLAIAGGGR